MHIKLSVPAKKDVQKFGQTRLKFAVDRDCMHKHFSKNEIVKSYFSINMPILQF